MTAVYSATWEEPDTINVILEGTRNVDCQDTAVAMGAAAIKLDVDTHDLALLTITDCDGDAGRHPRDLGERKLDPPVSRVFRFQWIRS